MAQWEESDRLDLNELRSFLALVKHRHFEKAALELKTSQPRVTRHLKNLERDLDTALFIRRPGRRKAPWRRPVSHEDVQLTDAGEELRVRATRILWEADEARRAIQALRRVEDGAVRIVLTAENHNPVVAAVAAMLRTMPEERVVLEEESDIEVIAQGVGQGRFHLGVMMGLAWFGRTVTHHRLSDAPWRLIVNKQHPIATTQGPRGIRTLARERFALPTLPAIARRGIDHYFLHQQFSPKIALETSTSDSVLASIRECPSLITILPVPQHVDQRDLALLDLAEAPDVPLATYLFWRGDVPSNESARRVAGALRAYFESGAPGRSSRPAPTPQTPARALTEPRPKT